MIKAALCFISSATAASYRDAYISCGSARLGLLGVERSNLSAARCARRTTLHDFIGKRAVL
jgi:hypothetical protein